MDTDSFKSDINKYIYIYIIIYIYIYIYISCVSNNIIKTELDNEGEHGIYFEVVDYIAR